MRNMVGIDLRQSLHCLYQIMTLEKWKGLIYIE